MPRGGRVSARLLSTTQGTKPCCNHGATSSHNAKPTSLGRQDGEGQGLANMVPDSHRLTYSHQLPPTMRCHITFRAEKVTALPEATELVSSGRKNKSP